MKGKELKSKKISIELLDGVHECMFDMNALAELEDIYGDIQTAMDKFNDKPIGAIRSFIYSLLKADNEDLTIGKVGKLIPMDKIEVIIKNIVNALNDSLPESEKIIEKEEEDNPNV